MLSVQNSPDVSLLVHENDKQYETKRAWNFLQSWLVGNKGVLKGGGGFNYSSPLKFFLGKSEEKVQRRCKMDGERGGGTC